MGGDSFACTNGDRTTLVVGILLSSNATRTAPLTQLVYIFLTGQPGIRIPAGWIDAKKRS